MRQMVLFRTLILTVLVLLVSVAPAIADDTTANDEATKKLMERVEQLEKRLAELETAPAPANTVAPAATEPATDTASAATTTEAAQEQTPPPPPAASEAVYSEPMDIRDDRDVTYGTKSSFLTWHGYLDLEYGDLQGPTPGTFDNHEFYLATKARMTERLGFTAEFEYEHNPEKLILPIQAYGDLTFSRALTFRAGLWYSPIGMPRGYTLRGNRNRMIRQVALTHDLLFENWADVGIAAFGEFQNGVFYDVAVGNGMPNTMGPGDSWFDAVGTLQDHTEDNNNNKALHSRFGYHGLDLGGGEINAAFSYGTQKYDPANTKRLTYKGADIRYLHNTGWRVQAEYLTRNGDDNPADLLKGMGANADGWYFQVSKRFVFDSKWAHSVEPVIQVDSIDWNRHVKDNHDQLTKAIGVIFSPVENYLLKFEYDFVDEKGARLNNNKLWLAAVIEF